MSSSVFQVSTPQTWYERAWWRAEVTVVLVFIFIALFLGLLPPLLGLDSALLVGGIVLILLALVLFSVVVIVALNGREWPLIAFLCFSVFLIDASFRQRELTAQSMDWQTLMKLVVWGFSLLIALVVTPNFFKRLFHGDMKWLSMLSLLAVCSSHLFADTCLYLCGGVAMVSYCALGSMCRRTTQ